MGIVEEEVKEVFNFNVVGLVNCVDDVKWCYECN